MFKSGSVIIILYFVETIEEQVSSEEAAQLCLSDEICLKLAELAITLERVFRNPRDIEFAIKEVRIFEFTCRYSKLYVLKAHFLCTYSMSLF